MSFIGPHGTRRRGRPERGARLALHWLRSAIAAGALKAAAQQAVALAAVSLMAALMASLAAAPAQVLAQSENLLNRIANKRMAEFEQELTDGLNAHLARYVSRHQYVVAVKVIWNPNIVPIIENPEMTKDQAKLPGFPIFVKSPDSPVMEESTPPFTRLEVKVLIDETLPDYYESFVRKLVPIVVRFDYNRGDQVVVLKETFPVLPKEEEPPPTLPERELMEQLGTAPARGALPPQQFAPGAVAPVMPMQGQQRQQIQPRQRRQADPVESAQIAYDEGRYRDALRIVQSAFAQATSNRSRAMFLGMEGSIYFTLNNVGAAQAAWRRAVAFDPNSMEIHEALNYLESQAGGTQ